MSEQFDPYHRWLGISPKDQPPHHYRLLGIDLFESDPEVIRDAAEQRIAHVRTYQLGRHMAVSQQILNELGAAKACLLDAVRKAAYDATLRESIAPAAPAPPEPVVPPPKPEPTPPQTTSSADELASPPIEVQPWLPSHHFGDQRDGGGRSGLGSFLWRLAPPA